MVEATIVCVDDSDYMRNGDFSPTRLEAQRDAVNFVCGTKLQSHPESTVALMTMAGRREVLTTLTTDIGKILTAVHNVQPSGTLDLYSGILVAQLALKHRQSKNHRQRIIAFVGSPVDADEKELVKLGKKLKKNNVSVDLVSFGEEEANSAKLEAFINAVNKDDSSHLVTVPSGARMLSDALMTSQMFASGDGDGGSGGGGANDFPYGVDPNLDPEMALALRVSMEEERSRQEAEARRQAEAAAAEKAPGAGDATDAGAPAATADDDDDAMDAELRAAMAMSMGVDPGSAEAGGMAAAGLSAMSEEEQIARALALSQMDVDAPAESAKTEAKGDGEKVGDMLQDPAFLSSVLSELPNVDPNDAEIREAVSNLVSSDKKDDDDKDKDGDVDMK